MCYGKNCAARSLGLELSCKEEGDRLQLLLFVGGARLLQLSLLPLIDPRKSSPLPTHRHSRSSASCDPVHPAVLWIRLFVRISVLGKSRSSGSISICWQHVHLINPPRRSVSNTSGHRAALRNTRGGRLCAHFQIRFWHRAVSCRALPWPGEPLLTPSWRSRFTACELCFFAPSQG